jgi:hypothetical protein
MKKTSKILPKKEGKELIKRLKEDTENFVKGYQERRNAEKKPN